MTMVRLVVVWPVVFEAWIVTVYRPALRFVPVIKPVAEFRVRPLGSPEAPKLVAT